MFIFLIGLIVFCCVLLVLIILAQNAKGGGLSSQFGGSGASNIIGVKKTGDLLERLTWIFVAALMILSLSANFIGPSQSGGNNEVLERVGEQAAPNRELQIPAQDEDLPAPDSTQ